MRDRTVRRHAEALHVLLQRRSVDEKWPRRLALLCVVSLMVYVLYVLFREVEKPADGVWTTRYGNTASRRVGDGSLGLPDVSGAASVHESDPMTDSAFAERGAMHAARIIDYVNEREDVEHKMWIDAGLAMHHATKTKSKISSPSILALGMYYDDRDLVMSYFDQPDFPKQDGCAVQLVHSPVPPDGGWYLECNTVNIRVLLYEDHNDTHFYLPWPKGYVRCLHCTTDELYLPKDTVAAITECGKWGTHTALHGHTYCPEDMDAYLANWTGNANWAELHTGHMFNHAKLTRALHDTFYATLHLIITLVMLVIALVALVFMASKATTMIKRD